MSKQQEVKIMKARCDEYQTYLSEEQIEELREYGRKSAEIMKAYLREQRLKKEAKTNKD